MKKLSQTSLKSDQLLIHETEQRVFRQQTDGLYIGTDKIDNVLRSVLRDEAVYILNSRIWEVLNATIVNEASSLALKNSMNWDHVLSAKQLYYWQQAMEKIIKKLAQ